MNKMIYEVDHFLFETSEVMTCEGDPFLFEKCKIVPKYKHTLLLGKHQSDSYCLFAYSST
jgi:hypothetical protein